MPGQLANKVAFITGVARGQGRSHAVRLAEEGAAIIGLDICRQVESVFYPMPTRADLEETERLVEKVGGRIYTQVADVRDLAAMQEAYRAGVAKFGDVDIAIANAGIMPIIGPGSDRQAWHDAIDTMLTGVWHVLETVVPRMVERGQGGSIVITSSSAGLSSLGVNTFPGSAGYTAAKHGVVGLMRLYAAQLAKHSIRVNTIHPTGVDTPMSNNDEFTQFAIANPDAVKGFYNALPVPLIEPVDISNAILYLVTDAGRYVTGTTLTVDAGYLVRLPARRAEQMSEHPVGSASSATHGPTSWGGLQYDHRSSKVRVDPFNLWSRLRKECPVLHSDNYGGFWFVSRYEDAKRILTEYESFSAAHGVTLPREPVPMLPLEVDPPAQRQYREVLNPHLTPSAVSRYEGFARDLARRLLAEVLPDGRIDLAHFAETYGHTVAMRALGFAGPDLDKLGAWCAVLFSSARDTEAGHRAGAELAEFVNAALDDRAGAGARDDLLSAIANAALADRLLDRGEQLSMVVLIIFGGFHTTGSTLTSALVWLADHPADIDRLRAEPGLLPLAVEEFVRYASPVSHMRRTTTRDVVINGCPIPAGEAVQFGIASANHDETVFEAPEEVILDRRPNRHLGFGSGPHRCVGSHLGKLAVRVGLEEFFTAVAHVEIEDHEALRYFASEGRAITYAPAIIKPRPSDGS